MHFFSMLPRRIKLLSGVINLSAGIGLTVLLSPTTDWLSINKGKLEIRGFLNETKKNILANT